MILLRKKVFWVDIWAFSKSIPQASDFSRKILRQRMVSLPFLFASKMFFTIYGTTSLILRRFFVVHIPKRHFYQVYTEAFFKWKIKVKVDKYCNGAMHTAFLVKNLFLIYADSTKINDVR